MASGIEILIEDDDTNTVFQFEKRANTMKGSIRSLDDGKIYQLQQKYNTVGREKCDVNINNLHGGGRHVVIRYDDQLNCFVMEDTNSPHGVYVNDCRVQNASVPLAHGDIIRFGHGGPRFDVILDIQSNPPVITQQAWNDGYHAGNNSNLPFLPLQNNVIKPYSTISYGRYNGYHGHNKTTEIKSPAIVPHPPARQRPVSANPANGVFLPSSSKPLSAGPPKDYSAMKTSDQVKELESRLLKMGDNLNQLISLENECYRKDNTIRNLQTEVESLQRALNDYNISIAAEHSQRLALLQSQISYKDDDVRRLLDENRQLKSDRLDYNNHSTNQIADMKTQLSRHEQNIYMMENEMRKANQEKAQMAMLVNTLQKEITAKDILLKKSKTDIERYKIDNRNKVLEISSLTSKIAKQTAVQEADRELKKREEEIGNLRYRLRTTEEKLNQKLSCFSDLEDSLSQSTYTVSEIEKSKKSLLEELSYSQSKCNQLECEEQALKIEIQNLKRKYDKFHQRIAEFIGREGKQISSVLDDEDVVNYIHELKDQRDNAQSRLQEVLTEKLQLDERVIDSASFDMLSDILSGMEKRLIQNGRSCKYLINELNLIQNFDVPEQLTWIKNFVTSFLSQEYNWEQGIEDALESMIEETSDQGIDPTVLIKRLHEKLNINAGKIHDLEIKYRISPRRYPARISASEYEHSQIYNDLKEKMKEKYKKKTEKALKEYRSAEELKFETKLRELMEEEREKLSLALYEQKELYQSDIGSVEKLSNKIESLKFEHRKAREEFKNLQNELEASRRSEASLQQKLREKDMAFQIKEEILDKKLKAKEMTEFQIYKDRNHEYSLTISSLENTILDINKEKKKLEYQLMNMHELVKEQKLDKKKQKKEDHQSFSKMKIEIKELNDMNQTLRENIVALKKERDDHKEIAKALKKDLEGVSAKLTDLKGELHEEGKQKIEGLQEKTKQQEKDLKEQRKQLLQLSGLVEEQKTKIIEQDKKLMKQNNTLAYQADGLREGQKEEKENEKKNVKFDNTVVSPADMVAIGERCLVLRHEQVIVKQKAALTELRDSFGKLEDVKPPIPSHDMALQHTSEIRRENIALKAQLAVKESFSSKTDQELYEEVCRSREDLALALHEINVEKQAHRETQESLHMSEELYLRCVRTISTELDVQHILGCKPLGYVDSIERENILNERNKALEIIVKRIKVLHSRLERKDNLLESYDGDLKVLRETEVLAGKKSAAVKHLEIELSQNKDEIIYLQEALKKCRLQLDDQTRMNTALKQRKIFLMDYKEDSPPKKHNCLVGEQKKFKDEQKDKKKDELLKKRKFEIENLKTQLWNADMELNNAKYRIDELQMSKSGTR